MRFVGCLQIWLLFCVSVLALEKAEGSGEAVHILEWGTPRPANLHVPRKPAGASSPGQKRRPCASLPLSSL